jgi:hypothetical protein
MPALAAERIMEAGSAARTGAANGADRSQDDVYGLIAETAAAHPEAGRFDVWLRDGAGIGQTCRDCWERQQRGTRPTGVKDQRHTAVYLFDAACPGRS